MSGKLLDHIRIYQILFRDILPSNGLKEDEELNAKANMKPKRLLVYILLTNLICVFPAGHAVIFLGLFEPILIAGTISGDNESPTMWALSAILLLLGQVVLLLALMQKTDERINQLGLLGITILGLAVASVYYTMQERVWIITLLTTVPFMMTSWLFFKKRILEASNVRG